MKYVRTDATTEYFQFDNPRWIIYNPITKYFYVTDPQSNHLFVLDSVTQMKVAAITVPGAFGIDDSADHKTLYLGTLIGDVYTVDPIALVVTHRYVASQIGPSGYFALSAVVLADGRLALLGNNGGISIDGSASYALWDPASNSFSLGTGYCNGFGSWEGISRTVDRAKIILSNADGGALCLVDEATGTASGFGPGGLPQMNFRVSPDGKYIVTPGNTSTSPLGTYAYVYDSSTLALVNQIPVSGNTSTGSGFAFSADSKTLYAPNDWVIYAYDLATGQQVGWLPNINVPIIYSGVAFGPSENPNLQALDETGLLVGPMEEGVGFIDTTILRTGPVGSEFPNGYTTPGTGPVSGGTEVKITEPATFGTLSGIYFGAGGATNISGVSGPNIYGNYGSVTGTTRASSHEGPVDVYVSTSDGGVQLIPEGFSFGPTIVEVTPDLSTAEGSGTGIIYGYGFGPVGVGVEGPVPNKSKKFGEKSYAAANVPSSLQVSVGGTPVPVTGFAPYAYNLQSPPFPLQALAYTIPPGAGTGDVVVTSGSGSTKMTSGLGYLPSIQQFPLKGAALAQAIYDPYRDVYYFTDTNKIQVFSKATGAWQTPISISAPAGTTERLWGIALSPDGSKLAVSDATAGVIYVLDPSHPTSVRTWAVNKGNVGIVNPSGVAISDSGTIYYAVYWIGISGGRGFYSLDTNTGVITDYDIAGAGGPNDIYYRVAISSDNSRVFFNDDGFVFYVDTATNSWTPSSANVGCCYGDYELALAANQKQFAASSYFYDFDLDAESYVALNNREAMSITYVYGAKLSSDGNLLFQPSTNGIDVLDGHVGHLIHRISLPVAMSSNYDALAVDGKDNILIAITGEGDGIAIVDLSSVAEPNTPAYRRYVPRFPHQNHATDTTRGSRSNTLAIRSAPRVAHVTKPLIYLHGPN